MLGRSLRFLIPIFLLASVGIASLSSNTPYVFACLPALITSATVHKFPAPGIILYQRSVDVGEELYVFGYGFASDSSAKIVIRAVGAENWLVFHKITDEWGNFSLSIEIADDIPTGHYSVAGLDLTDRWTSTWPLIVRNRSDPQLVLSTSHFSWYFHHPEFYLANQQNVSAVVNFAEEAFDRYVRDFNYTLPNIKVYISNENDQMTRLYVGWAGGDNLGFSADIFNDLYSARSFVAHELANRFQGNASMGWPWTDAHGLWQKLSDYPNSRFVSPFPYAASIMLLAELHYWKDATRKLHAVTNDCGFQLLWAIFQVYGWEPYTGLFQAIRQLNVDLSQYDATGATALIASIMSRVQGVNFLRLFNSTFAYRNMTIQQSTLGEIMLTYPILSGVTHLPAPNIAVTGSTRPILVPRTSAPFLTVVTAITVSSILIRRTSHRPMHISAKRAPKA